MQATLKPRRSSPETRAEEAYRAGEGDQLGRRDGSTRGLCRLTPGAHLRQPPDTPGIRHDGLTAHHLVRFVERARYRHYIRTNRACRYMRPQRGIGAVGPARL